MDKKFGVFILLGLLIGAMLGVFFRANLEEPLLSVAFGALKGLFIGWFIAIIYQKNNQSTISKQ